MKDHRKFFTLFGLKIRRNWIYPEYKTKLGFNINFFLNEHNKLRFQIEIDLLFITYIIGWTKIGLYEEIEFGECIL